MKMWAVAVRSETMTNVCRLGAMENDTVGPLDLPAIFKTKRKASKVMAAFVREGYTDLSLVALKVEEIAAD